MKKVDLITAIVLAALGLGIIAYGVLDVVYFGIEALSLICLIGGAAAVALAAFLTFAKELKAAAGRDVPDQIREPAAAPKAETVTVSRGTRRCGIVLAAAILSGICTILAVLFARGIFAVSANPVLPIETTISRSAYMQVVWGTVASACLFFGYFKSLKWGVLVGAICECIAAVVFILWLLFHVLPIVFGFVGYAKMRKVSDSDTGEI